MNAYEAGWWHSHSFSYGNVYAGKARELYDLGFSRGLKEVHGIVILPQYVEFAVIEKELENENSI